jgi:hypothetical protein
MPKVKRERKRKIRQERRSDEASLYYIIERDLDRGALFPEHDGWVRQVQTGKGTVDYVVKYGKKLLGIEVKVGFPDIRHFEQVSKKYSRALDAIFLAYPSDAVAEALFISESKATYPNIGLISIALYRSHIARPATIIQRTYQKIWNDQFDDRAKMKRIKRQGFKTKYQIPATAVECGGSMVSYSKSGEELPEDDFEVSEISSNAGYALSVLYHLNKIFGAHRYFSYSELKKYLAHVNYRAFSPRQLIRVGLADFRSYGDSELFLSISEGALFLVESGRVPDGEFFYSDPNIKKAAKIWKKKHEEEQKKQSGDFLKHR